MNYHEHFDYLFRTPCGKTIKSRTVHEHEHFSDICGTLGTIPVR